ncbi:histidine phosphatase family protein [Peribacillus frigoritolerans]|uniref:histidine phosphatase family protein n=1 Tax=Peribacillus frigoritolerans TaxID=450367 RepID=UPI0010594F4F|nr:histidine phosphatase family protein [Peribacillus frigoritolerans]TDL83161.1 histidine phosphatase family protein [Peribacillus frigoritolerans]
MESCRSLQLILIRHGLTEWNKEKRYIGHTDLPVMEDSFIEYESLKKTLQNYLPDIVYSSDLLRCQQTAAFLFPEEAPIKDPRLREISFGIWEGKTYEDLKNDFHYSSWLDNWEITSTPGGESGIAFHKRVSSFLSEVLKSKLSSAAIMTHGGVIRKIVSDLVPEATFWDTSVSFGKAIVLELRAERGKWKCISLSEEPSAGKEPL